MKKQFIVVNMKDALEGIEEMPQNIKLRVVDGNDTYCKLEYDATEETCGLPEILMNGHDVYKDSPHLLTELLNKIGIDDDDGIDSIDDDDDEQLCGVM